MSLWICFSVVIAYLIANVFMWEMLRKNSGIKMKVFKKKVKDSGRLEGMSFINSYVEAMRSK
jgi:hypothetical protein